MFDLDAKRHSTTPLNMIVSVPEPAMGYENICLLLAKYRAPFQVRVCACLSARILHAHSISVITFATSVSPCSRVSQILFSVHTIFGW